MPTCTAQMLVDLDGDGVFETDLCAAVAGFPSGFWKAEQGFSLTGRGRQKEYDAGGMASAVIVLDNRDGRFSPKNTGGAYYPNWTPYKLIQVQLVFNGVTYYVITGTIADIKVNPDPKAQTCEITIRDYMFLCSRTEIRRPLMRNQFTGMIIHRLLDDVEGVDGRELAVNPRFEFDDSGWTIVGTATKNRVTTGEILEGSATESVSTSATFSGVQSPPFSSNVAGQNITITAYVHVEGDADIGKTIQIRMQDDIGLITSSAAQMTDRDHWYRLSLSGTYNGGSAQQFIRIVATASGTNFRVGAIHATPAVNAFSRLSGGQPVIDDGQSRLEQFFYHRGPALDAIQQVRDSELGGLFYFDGQGIPHFEDRHHRWKSDHLTSQNTFSDTASPKQGAIIDYVESGDDRYKGIILDFPHYVAGDPGTEIKRLDRTVVIPPLGTVRVELDYDGGLVRDAIKPVANTDYTITSDGGGAGADMSGSVAFTFEDFGGGSVGTFVSAVSRTTYLTFYRVRATPVRAAQDTSPARYTATGGPALAATLSHNYRWNASEPSVQAWAEYLGQRYSTQRERLSVTLSSPFPNANLETDPTKPQHTRPILARQVSDRVTVTDTALPMASKINSDYYIDSIAMRIQGSDESGFSLGATWNLTPVDASYWILGTHQLDTTTVLAP